MPRISAFYGIVIWMYHDEAHHLGRPHLHATYGDDEASVDIESLEILAGELPRRARRLVGEPTVGSEPDVSFRVRFSSPDDQKRASLSPTGSAVHCAWMS